MSSALNSMPDLSIAQSVGNPEFSLGSISSGFSTPARKTNRRVPSTTSATTAPSSAPVSTPSPPPTNRRKEPAMSLSRRLSALNDHDDDIMEEEDVLGTPGAKKKGNDEPETPMPARSAKRAGRASKGAPLTLRDQEKHIDSLKKENFNVKLRVHFLEERLAQLAPDQMDQALKQNINLKIEVQNRGLEIKKLKKLVLELERELERLQKGHGSSRSRERELEEKLDERDREIKELRRKLREGRSDNDAMRELENRNEELEAELGDMRSLLEDNVEEINRLRVLLEGGGNEDIHHKREDLLDEIERLRLQLEDIQRRREAESYERSQSRAQVIEEREEREAVEDNLSAMKDKLAAVMIELQQKEDELELKDREMMEIEADYKRQLEDQNDEWREEMEEAKGQVEELRDVLNERESECRDLRLSLTELENNTNDLHNKFEITFAHQEEQLQQKEKELQSLQAAFDDLSDKVYQLEDENDRLREDAERQHEEDAVDRERLEAVCAGLKEKIAHLKDELQDMTDACDAATQQAHDHRAQQEELARHIEDLVAELQKERAAHQEALNALDRAEADHESAMRREHRALESKESLLNKTNADLARAESLLSQREADLEAVQQALQTLEAESKRLGESHTTARFSLQLEVDRLKRDLERLEDELSRARKELAEKEARSFDHNSVLDKLHAENRDLASQLAAQTQAKLNTTEKLDVAQASLKAKEDELVELRKRVLELETRLSKEQRQLLAGEAQYRDQLTERNTLLLTIYQYMDKILGVDKTPKKGGQAETKPFTNFGVFHDNLITRLKQLSQIHVDFEKRAKEAENRFADKLTEMRKQLDNRWKQIDKFEASVKVAAESKATWRRKMMSKEGEIEALKSTNAEMAAQLASGRKPGTADPMELRSALTRAANAERRQNNTANQLAATEERFHQYQQRSVAADMKWEARVKEYETRLKAAEERYKREKQGAKDRQAEMERTIALLTRQVEETRKRNQHVGEIVEANKVTSNSPGR
ncbi:uncharacterized protein SCHCODRAFT_02604140 [Schizophyllum commune H4-8]|uniref:uncharacterized protein n=1 Tax=Schizophyllum commune (strain H4-8 / FGSC 9210) TaxID=578458 RepID=UPI00215F2C32|nr:uncharacterized protein SCHCODRAFT_02604140 [Schizophyllum commune H4-8]KAI5899088.1 hypothetical protein SCHCODRAFT_02604140 [Schizophyllum commune H4-8]